MLNRGFFSNALIIIVAVVVGMYYLDKQGKLEYFEQIYQKIHSIVVQK